MGQFPECRFHGPECLRTPRWARGKPLATGRIWFARAVMVQIPEDHQIMIEIVALLGQQSVVAAK